MSDCTSPEEYPSDALFLSPPAAAAFSVSSSVHRPDFGCRPWIARVLHPPSRTKAEGSPITLRVHERRDAEEYREAGGTDEAGNPLDKRVNEAIRLTKAVVERRTNDENDALLSVSWLEDLKNSVGEKG